MDFAPMGWLIWRQTHRTARTGLICRDAINRVSTNGLETKMPDEWLFANEIV